MPTLGVPELLLILGIVVLIFGASRLPEIGKGLGQSIQEFRTAISEEQEAEQGSSQPVVGEEAGG